MTHEKDVSLWSIVRRDSFKKDAKTLAKTVCLPENQER